MRFGVDSQRRIDTIFSSRLKPFQHVIVHAQNESSFLLGRAPLCARKKRIAQR